MMPVVEEVFVGILALVTAGAEAMAGAVAPVEAYWKIRVVAASHQAGPPGEGHENQVPRRDLPLISAH